MSAAGRILGLAVLCFIHLASAQSPTVTSLTISAGGGPVSTSREGTVVTLTATVTLASGGPAAPPGQVIFCEVAPAPLRCTDIRLLGLAQLSSAGAATFKFMPGPGPHNYQAIFLGTHIEAGSASSAAPLFVASYAPTITELASSGSPGDYTLTATVTTTGGTAPPTGSILFQDTDNANYVLAAASPLVPGPSMPGLGFAYSSPEFAGPGPAVVTADFNGDGKLDMAIVANPFPSSNSTTQNMAVQNTMSIFFGNGDGTFTLGPTFNLGPPGTICYYILAADLNGDGKQDIVVPFTPINGPFTQARVDSLQVLIGNGDGTFTAGEAIPTETSVVPVTGDFNGDGIPDLAYVDGGGANFSLYTLLGRGDGTFVAKSSTPVSSLGGPPAVGDFNEDGNIDIVVGYGDSNSLTVLLGKGDGTFDASAVNSVTASSTSFVTTADFNGDGVLDLAVSNDQVGLPAEIVVLLGNGDGTFAAPNVVPAPSAAAYSGLAVGDFNGDGIADLSFGAFAYVVTNGNVTSVSYIDLMLGNGDGTFAAAKQFPSSSYFSVRTAADFNGDGLSDALVEGTSGQIATLLSTLGSETFTATGAGANISVVGTGTHLVDASYSGDVNYQPSVSAPIGLTAEPVPTTLTLAASPAAINYGQPVTLTATISPSTPQQDHVPTGTVTFSNGSTVVGTSPVSNGAATFTTSVLPTGTASITAAYSGDTNFTASTSASTSVTVTGYGSTTGLTVTPNPASVGQTVTLSAAVAPVGTGYSSGPTGTVSFYDGAKQIGQVALDASGHAVFATSALAIGSHVLTASYSGDAAYYASSSAATTLVVNILADATALTVSPNPAGLGQPVTLSAAVAGTGFGSGTTPSGTITFYDGGAALATGALDATGHAVYTTSALTLGTHSLTAVYSGSAAFAVSTSVAVAEIVVKADFSIALSSPTITLQTYQHTTTTVTLASLGNFTDNLAMSCGDLPAYVTCIFTPNPAALAANSTATVSFYLDTDSILGGDGLNGPVHGSRRPPPLTIGLALLFLPLGLMQAAGKRRRRQMPQLMLTVSVIALIVSLGGCGTSQITPVPSAAPGTYTIPITATGATTGATHTAQLTFTVTP